MATTAGLQAFGRPSRVYRSATIEHADETTFDVEIDLISSPKSTNRCRVAKSRWWDCRYSHYQARDAQIWLLL